MLSKNIRYFSTSLSQFARNRSKQILFRKALIDKYSKCAITDIHPNLCDACHIIPYSVSNNYDVNNGILLSKNMHAAFDRKYFTIDENTCQLKILYHNIQEDRIEDLENLDLEKYNGVYVPQLDNIESRTYLSTFNIHQFP